MTAWFAGMIIWANSVEMQAHFESDSRVWLTTNGVIFPIKRTQEPEF